MAADSDDSDDAASVQLAKSGCSKQSVGLRLRNAGAAVTVSDGEDDVAVFDVDFELVELT